VSSESSFRDLTGQVKRRRIATPMIVILKVCHNRPRAVGYYRDRDATGTNVDLCERVVRKIANWIPGQIVQVMSVAMMEGVEVAEEFRPAVPRWHRPEY